MTVGILCNGPGELWGWARPTIRELRSRGHDVLLWLLHCPYASGGEYELAVKNFDCGVVAPMSPQKAYFDLARAKVDSVIQLGGDIFWGRRLAGKAPLICYTYGRKNRLAECDAVATAFELMARSIPNARIIGDLVSDSLAMDGGTADNIWRHGYAGRRILFLPGSRANIRTKALPYLLDVVAELRRVWSDFEPAVLFSPFARDDELDEWRRAELNPARAPSGAAFRAAEYVLTQPGTNTLEMLHCGTPGLVVAPLRFLQEMPVSGIGGLISSIPCLGAWLKKKVLQRKLRRLGTLSWPNRVAEEPLLDEMSGDITPRTVAEKLISALSDGNRLSYVRSRLLSYAGGEGAAKRLCDIVEDLQ